MAGIGSTPSLVVGIAAGAAASAALEPALEIPKQEAWQKAAYRLPDVALIARLYVSGEVDRASALDMASRLGFSEDRFDAFAYLAQVTPSAAEVLNLWRRFSLGDLPAGDLPEALVDHALAHEGMDWDYVPYLKQLKTAELIGLGDIATAIVRGAVPAPSWVPVAPPTHTDHVPRFPVTDIDPVKLAAALGFSEDMLRIMTARSGLSLAPILATQAFFRGALTDNDWLLAIAEGDLRTEWAETLREAARAIPSADQYVEARLRGWITEEAAHAGAARHGMVADDADLLYEIHRRPLPVATITKALARGGTFEPAAGEIQDPYSASVHQLNLGPEWYDLAEHMLYSYPSAFVLRQLLKDGTITADEAEAIFTYEGWPPDLAKRVAEAYAPSEGTVADPHVSKAETQLWTTLHRSYVAEETDDTTATKTLTTIGVPAPAQPKVLALWQAERALVRKQLTPAQVKSAYKNAVTNPATGSAWTQDDALTALLDRGYSMNDATTFLNT